MKCVKPFVRGAAAFGCGQCMPCRFNKRRVWTHRLMLEGMDYVDKAFITLTYEEKNLPADGGLVPEHFTAWLKRLRKSVEPRRLRFFGVGEYGDNTGRPHYHAAVFGYPSCQVGVATGGCECLACSGVRRTWGFGHVLVGKLELQSAQYIAGYVTKKMTSRTDPRLRGRHPEFARMSLRPGIGANAMHDVASVLMQYKLDKKDVPLALGHGKKEYPLGRYLRGKLRSMVGKDERSPPEAVEQLSEAMRLVRAFAWAEERSVGSVFQELNQPYADQIEGRIKLREKVL